MPASTCVILVPGFKGSILTSDGKPVWVSLGQAFFPGDSLAIDRPDLGVPNPLHLSDAGVLGQITLVPGLFKIEIFGPTLRALRAGIPKDWDMRAWSYDWRRDADDIVNDFDAFVAAIFASGVTDVRVVAHSMGGMLTAAWLLRPGAERGAAGKVSHVAFVAGAFRGTTKLFRNLQTGDDPVGRNTTLLSAAALSTFPSSYSFIPDAWPLVIDTQGKPVAAEFRDPMLWERGHWGIFRDGNAKFADARRAFLAERFGKSRAFLHGIADPAAKAPSGLKVHNAIGTGVATINQLIQRTDGTLVVNETQRKADSSLASLSLEADGDGTIAAHSAELPPGLAARAVAPTVRVPGAEHMAVVQKGAGLDATLKFITS